MLPKGPYQPQSTEEEILAFWLENNFYSPEYKSEKRLSTSNQLDRETFSIVLPPPNANGNLHLGHMSGYAYQDLMGRYNRMKGKKVLLLPGKDHAGILTEVVFEKELEKEGLSKKSLGREEFYKRCYDFCIKNSENARRQEKNIGLSADFDRELFTLEPKIVDEVLKAFELMYEDKLVYRDKRIINWCPRCQSALADIDTEFKDSQSPFYYFKYAFTEPETDALKLKNEFKGKVIEWDFERNSTNDGELKLPFSFGKYQTLEIIGIGYDDEQNGKLSGKVIGIQMRLDKNFRLVVLNQNQQIELKQELDKIFLFEIQHYAGAHIILFDEYSEDKYYTNGFILGTVRPETKFGDTALAVDPDDKRYKDFVGKNFEVKTLLGTSKINIIADNAVDENFGTGMVKVTPAHSPEDWDIAKRHPEEAFPEKQVIDFNGKMNHLAGKYEGLYVKEARKVMLEDMKSAGMLVYLDENYTNRIRICERCKYPIEPLISYQWFVDTEPLKREAKRLVEEKFTDIMPEGKKKTYIQWMESKEDWCITRQLWWGYRVPVWYKGEHSQYITETGEVKEKIGDKIIDNPEDYDGLIYVGHDNPNTIDEAKQKDLESLINISVLRHGETEYNKLGKFHGITDIELNDIGRKQAQEAKDKINNDYDVIISSPLKRARQTAEIVNEKLGLEIIENDLLKERDFGNLEGLTWEEFSEQYPQEASKNNIDFQPELEKGERIEDVEKRLREFITWLKTSGYKKPLLVTHAGVIRVIERKLNNLTPEQSRENDPENLELRNYKLSPSEWVQDEDVLDTWFSSGQWPYLTLMVKEGDFEEFYPSQVMETGWDILLFWVTRMMLLNPYRAKKLNPEASDKEIVPFKNVYLHGLVLDKNGVKMSKSKGNGIDPFEMMQKYGTDALRYSFIKGNSAGQNYRLYEEKVSSNRNFCNKIWNASKFALFNIEDCGEKLINTNQTELNFTQDDKDMLEHIDKLAVETTRRLDEFKFGIAADELYESFWHYFADIYLEKIKTRLYTKDRDGNAINTSDEEMKSRFSAQWLILHSLETYLKLLHPFIPFLTEKIWQSLPKREGESESIMYSKWPD
jgi:valyl-tRNA synthetase